jgi:hemoglobin-like flavoprotein
VLYPVLAPPGRASVVLIMRNPFRRKPQKPTYVVPLMPELDPDKPWERMNRRPSDLTPLAEPGPPWVQLVPADPGPWHELGFSDGHGGMWRRQREPDPSELAETVSIEKDDPMTTDASSPDPIRYDSDFYGQAARHEDEQGDSTPLHTATASVSPAAGGSPSWEGPPQPWKSPADQTPQPADSDDRQDCPHCRGTGKVLSVNDLLRESIGLLDGNEDAVIREFYARLLTAAPDLAPLFPRDLLAEDEIDHQRDRLLAAIVALAKHYDPDNDEAMATLDTALASYGRAHSAFRRPDGSVRGATLEEYVAVKSTLFSTLHDAAGAAWLDEYDGPWSEAYDYAAIRMLSAQLDTPQRFGRFPRQ